MAEVIMTVGAMGGRSMLAPATGAERAPVVWVPPSAIEEFAVRHHKQVRYLNRGAVLTATVIDAALRRRWPDPARQPRRLSLIVGTGFGNQGETTRYFASIRARGAEGVSPMASYDVSVNSFASFASIFFRIRAITHTMSSGAASGADALASALCFLETGEADAVLVVGVEPESAEAHGYVDQAPGFGGVEACAVVLLERDEVTGPAFGAVLGAETGFGHPTSGRRAQVLERLVARLLVAAGRAGHPVSAVYTGPAWTDAEALARRALEAPGATWLDGTDGCSPWQIGASAIIGCACVLQHLGGTGRAGLGLVLAADPDGWLGAVLVSGGPREAATDAASTTCSAEVC